MLNFFSQLGRTKLDEKDIMQVLTTLAQPVIEPVVSSGKMITLYIVIPFCYLETVFPFRARDATLWYFLP